MILKPISRKTISQKAGVLLLVTIISLSSFTVTANTSIDNSKNSNINFDIAHPMNILPKGTQNKDVLLSEGFEGGVVPPAGWSKIVTVPAFTWISISGGNPHSGTYRAVCFYDYNLNLQNEWLITPTLDFRGLTNIKLSFWWFMSYYYGVNPYNNYDLNVSISTNGGSSWTFLWNENNLGVFTNWQWYNASMGTPINLSAYSGQSNVKIGFQYKGRDGAEMSLDDILLTATVSSQNPPATPAAPSGPTSGSTGVSYSFTASTTDPEGDNISYKFFWDDGTDSGWLGPYASGAPATASHAWTAAGSYNVTVKAKDATGESGESPAHTIVISASPTIEIGDITGGLLKVKAVIKNTGSGAASNVSWKIELTGGLILIGKSSTGTIPTLNASGEVTVSSKLIVGFGKTVVKVTADTATKSINATVLLVYIKI